MKTITRNIYTILAASIAIGLSACGGGSSPAASTTGAPGVPKITSYLVGGYAGGLAYGETVTLLNGSDTVTLSGNGAFTFPASMPLNGSYAVTIGTQPSTQTCSVSAGAGSSASAVTSVRVNCAAAAKYAYVSYAASLSAGAGWALSGPSGISQYSISNGAMTLMAASSVPAGAFTAGVTAHPGGKYVYAANYDNGGNGVYQYTVGSNGALAPMTPAYVPAQSETISIAVDPTGRYVYAANRNNAGSGLVSQYTVGQNGALTLMSPSWISTDFGANSVAVDPTGRYVYVACNGSGGPGNYFGVILQYAIGANGTLSGIGGASIGGATHLAALAVAVSPDGKYAYGLTSADITQYAIGTNGTLTAMGSAFVSGAKVGGNAFTIDSFGTNMYVTNTAGGVTQVSIAANGNLIADASATTGNVPVGLAVDPYNAFVVNYNDSTISQYTVNQTSGGANIAGGLTPTQVVPSGANPNGIALVP